MCVGSYGNLMSWRYCVICMFMITSPESLEGKY